MGAGGGGKGERREIDVRVRLRCACVFDATHRSANTTTADAHNTWHPLTHHPPPPPFSANRRAPGAWPTQQQQQQQPDGASAANLQAASPSASSSPSAPAPRDGQRRGFALAIARRLEGRVYNLRNDVVANNFDGLADYLIKVVPKWIKFAVAGPAQSNDDHNELTLYSTADTLLPLMRFLRDHVNTQFKCLIDVTAVDFPERPARFEVVYHLLSPRWNNRIRVKVCVDEVTPVPSVCSVWPAANWFERETWDMFGVFFRDHPDMRRILTDYGFTGHPLRKDFPLSGFTEVRYDFAKKRVVSEPLELTQEFRHYDFQSPWETLPR